MLWERPERKIASRVMVELARKATALHPDKIDGWEALAHSLRDAGKDEEVVALLSGAVSQAPTSPQLHLMLADAYCRTGRYDLARQAVFRTPTTPWDDRETALWRLRLLLSTATAEDARHVAYDILALDPANGEAIEVLGDAARRDGTSESMIPICEAALRRQPGHARAVYELAVAYGRLGRHEAARELIDLDRFLAVEDLAPPHGYEGPETFEAALRDEIMRNPTLKPDPAGKATRRGFQTSSNLAHAADPAMGLLLDLIRSTIDRFVAKMPGTFPTSFIEARPEKAWLNAWAVVYSSEGHQVAHIHADAWLSGIYYVSAPEAGDGRRDGCLVLGEVDLQGIPPWGTRDISPAPGKLVLFPSFIPHGTIPTHSPEPRICIAFDVMPVTPAKGAGYRPGREKT